MSWTLDDSDIVVQTVAVEVGTMDWSWARPNNLLHLLPLQVFLVSTFPYMASCISSSQLGVVPALIFGRAIRGRPPAEVCNVVGEFHNFKWHGCWDSLFSTNSMENTSMVDRLGGVTAGRIHAFQYVSDFLVYIQISEYHFAPHTKTSKIRSPRVG
jgi:hypothetical protein